MYIAENLKDEFRRFLEGVFGDPRLDNLVCLQICRDISRATLSRFKGLPQSIDELCIAVACSKLQIDFPVVSGELLSQFEFTKRDLLNCYHETMTPRSAENICAFDESVLRCAVDRASEQLDLRVVDFSTSRDRYQFNSHFLPNIDFPERSVYIDLAGKYDAASMLTNYLTIYESGVEKGSFALGKVFSIGFWKFAKKNTPATAEQVFLTVREPLSLSKRFADEMQSSVDFR